jgi:predicted  nucleic acid-binding Zn-ribbon protein
MSGSTRDIKRARALQQHGESLLYLRRAGKAYVIRDVATLDRFDALWAPVEAQGKKMDALGKQMDPLGKQMEALGRRMEKAHDADEQEALSREMDELGKQMDELGKQMDALGKDMDRLAKKAEADLAVLVDEALRNGKATEVKAPL